MGLLCDIRSDVKVTHFIIVSCYRYMNIFSQSFFIATPLAYSFLPIFFIFLATGTS